MSGNAIAKETQAALDTALAQGWKGIAGFAEVVRTTRWPWYLRLWRAGMRVVCRRIGHQPAVQGDRDKALRTWMLARDVQPEFYQCPRCLMPVSTRKGFWIA